MINVAVSRNAKTGVVAASYRGKQSCPLTCQAYQSCYAKSGPTNIVFNRAGQDENDAISITTFIASLAKGWKMRHHVAGDLVNAAQEIDKPYLTALIEALKKRLDLVTWSYTHAWRLFESNPFKGIVSVNFNASCDSITEIKEARAKGFDTVVIMPENAKSGAYDGERIVICPAQVNKAITCDKCLLCFKKDRPYSVGFRLHGNMKKKHAFAQVA